MSNLIEGLLNGLTGLRDTLRAGWRLDIAYKCSAWTICAKCDEIVRIEDESTCPACIDVLCKKHMKSHSCKNSKG